MLISTHVVFTNAVSYSVLLRFRELFTVAPGRAGGSTLAVCLFQLDDVPIAIGSLRWLVTIKFV